MKFFIATKDNGMLPECWKKPMWAIDIGGDLHYEMIKGIDYPVYSGHPLTMQYSVDDISAVQSIKTYEVNGMKYFHIIS